MKKTCLFVVFLLIALFTGPAIIAQHKNHAIVREMLPGQTFNLTNRQSHDIEIRSQFPVQVAAGPCHADSTVQIRCRFDEPSDLFIRDLRAQPIFRQPQSNEVKIILSDD